MLVVLNAGKHFRGNKVYYFDIVGCCSHAVSYQHPMLFSINHDLNVSLNLKQVVFVPKPNQNSAVEVEDQKTVTCIL